MVEVGASRRLDGPVEHGHAGARLLGEQLGPGLRKLEEGQGSQLRQHSLTDELALLGLVEDHQRDAGRVEPEAAGGADHADLQPV
ncbi:MAG: hypothetical protein ACRDGB_12300, partial [Candidatus Limnocylindria bacterium]